MSSGKFATSYAQDAKLWRTNWTRFWYVVLVALIIYLPFVFENRSIFGVELTNTQLGGLSLLQINFAVAAIITAAALNLLTGYTGLISIGTAGFFAAGAMTAAILGVEHGWPFPAVLAVAAVVGWVVGGIVGLPSLRVRGLYLLMATLAFQFIMGYIFLEYQNNTFGEAGVRFTQPSFFGFQLNTQLRWYFFLVVLAAIVIILLKNVLRTRQGRAFVAVRDQEIAAGSVGINVAQAKLRSFALSSAIITVGGVLWVYLLRNATHEIFTLTLAIEFVAMIIIGGLGSLLGAVLGALVWRLMPSIIDTTSAELEGSSGIGGWVADNSAYLNNFLLGAFIIVVLLFKPDGLSGIWNAVKRFFQRWPFTT